MRSSLSCLLVALLFAQPLSAQYRTALPGYRFEFSRDYFYHPDFQTEWWYYTGNLKSADAHRFGFELTFFRQAITRDPAKSSAWDVRDLYLAHLALSDLDGQHFYHAERANRSGPGIAGVNQADARIWNGNWQIQWRGDEQDLQAVDDRFQLYLTLRAEKRPVIHGENGVSQKASGPGRASHYVSLTRLATRGSIRLNDKQFTVEGLAWMDHEFFTHQLEPDQAGWDWLSLQLDDNTELMLFRIRRRDGSIDPYSAGTFVDSRGGTTHLRQSDFTLVPMGKTWASPETHAVYPIAWKIEIPRLGVELQATTPLSSQELAGTTHLSPNYWEGSISLIGNRGAQPLQGVGYLEMTGYDRPFELAP
jgi:predicted secreted hydrolase